jgi:hypothetical protein
MCAAARVRIGVKTAETAPVDASVECYQGGSVTITDWGMIANRPITNVVQSRIERVAADLSGASNWHRKLAR